MPRLLMAIPSPHVVPLGSLLETGAVSFDMARTLVVCFGLKWLQFQDFWVSGLKFRRLEMEETEKNLRIAKLKLKLR